MHSYLPKSCILIYRNRVFLFTEIVYSYLPIMMYCYLPITFMLSKPKPTSQPGFYSTFEEQLSHSHPLYILANQINWNIFEEAFARRDSQEGRPQRSPSG